MKPLKKDESKCRVFVDLDGVLAEFRPECSLNEVEEKGYFLGLKPRNGMISAVRNLIKCGRYDVYVLSAVLPDIESRAVTEKNIWLNCYIPELGQDKRLFPVCGKPKNLAVTGFSKEDILLDDHSPNLIAWEKAGGKAVKILNEINGTGRSSFSGPRIRVRENEDLIRALNGL